MKVNDRIKQAYNEWIRVVEHSMDLAKTSGKPVDLDNIFFQFLRNVINNARHDEQEFVTITKRIENVKAFLDFSVGDNAICYMIAPSMLGYRDHEHLKQEITEYAPELLSSIGTLNSGRLSDDKEGRKAH